jgi:heme exporter protein C
MKEAVVPVPSTARTVPLGGGRVPLLAFDCLTALAMLAALYAIFVLSPAERVQGEVFRIFYVHLPLALLAYAAFLVVFVASIAHLWRRSPTADRVARAAAEVGVVFTSLVLVTGSLWGRPVWGVWWTWDARLTTTLVLWFVYVGYLMVRSAIAEPERAARIAAVIGIVGFVDVPIVQLSVTWWRTLHPQPTLTTPGALPPEMLSVLLVSLAAFGLLFARLVILRMEVIGVEMELQRLAQRLTDRTAG